MRCHYLPQFGGAAFLNCTKQTELTTGQSVKIVIVLGGGHCLSNAPAAQDAGIRFILCAPISVPHWLQM
jgi:hypothetical protein